MTVRGLVAWLTGLFSGKVQTSRNQEVGKWGEDVAAHVLKSDGYSIVGRRVRPDRRGDELDIIAEKDGVLVFVEVKTRRDERFGRPADAVDSRKRRALRRGAMAYMRKARVRMPYRLDIMEVVGLPGDGQKPQVRHIKGAAW